ncbi:MAG: NlpC/P60 family protein [Methylotenera sp.]|nr:NlpC/P60 family protein [Methylotenera sp.]
MNTHWAEDYIGIPWANGAQGPDAFDCWALVRHVNREHYGRELPIIQVDAHDVDAVHDAFAHHPEKSRWQPVAIPQDGDCVLTHKGEEIDHVGVFLDIDGGKILHALQGSGVVCTAPSVLKRMGWFPLAFYRFKGQA